MTATSRSLDHGALEGPDELAPAELAPDGLGLGGLGLVVLSALDVY